MTYEKQRKQYKRTSTKKLLFKHTSISFVLVSMVGYFSIQNEPIMKCAKNIAGISFYIANELQFIFSSSNHS